MPHQVDKYVGQRIRQRRWLLNMTQQQLAEKVGVKFQQIQKYETGANRVSASRLWDIADAMDVPVSHFFVGLKPQEEVPGAFFSHEEVELVRALRQALPAQKAALLGMAKSLNATPN